MRLTDLKPQFCRYDPPVMSPDGDGRQIRGARNIAVDTLAEAQGVWFNPPGTDVTFVIWFADRGVPDDAFPGGARWPVTGTGYDDMTLTPSILIPNYWHGFITNGEVTTC